VDCPAIYVNLYILFAVEHVDLDVIYSFQAVSGWRLRKMGRDLEQGKK